MIKLLANENFPYQSIKKLRSNGFDVFSISDNHSGISDKEVMEIANKEDRTILTFDRDYGELIFKHGYRPKQGIIYFRWDFFAPDEPAIYLSDLLTKG
jgi:predicted nuclease of predicted toxin-antitoxin system